MTLIVGIDPGTKTGLSIYDKAKGRLIAVESGTIIEMQNYLLDEVATTDVKKVRIEDATQRTWFGKAGREKLQGVGSVKRDCKIWAEFCTYFHFPFEMVHPKNNTTKLDAKTFKHITGWQGQTNEHKRDSGMLCYGF